MSTEKIEPRLCQCRFCRLHGAKTWSDPRGKATISISDIKSIARYRFALKTTDFLICGTCGAYIGALYSEADKNWSTLNLRLTGLNLPEGQAVNYGSENQEGRIARRMQAWTPTELRYG